MHNTRFIFVEGIVGAGKSTTAWFLTEQINALTFLQLPPAPLYG